MMARWELIGKYFGYPNCCIKWFTRRTSFILLPEQEAIHGSNGFIPCLECVRKVTSETIGTLITGRICKTSYPNAGSNEDLDNYLESLNTQNLIKAKYNESTIIS